MLQTSLLASLRARLFGCDRRLVRPRRRAKAVPSTLNLETLEDRLVPTASVFLNNGIVSIQDSTSGANAVVSTPQAGHVQVKLSGDTFAQSGPSGISGYGTNTLDIDTSLSGFGKYGLSMNMSGAGAISVAPGTTLTTGGSISLKGIAKTASNNVGVSINGAYLNASAISLTGNQYADGSSSLASNNNYGVLISGSSLTAGSVNITGDGEGIGSNEDGVVIGGASKVTATGTGGIAIQGYGSWGGQNTNVGVYVTDQGTVLSTGTGTLSISGDGGGHGSYNHGVDVQNSAQLTTHGGLLEILGSAFSQSTGSANDGIYFSSARVSTGGGNVAMTGNATYSSSSSDGIGLYSSQVNAGSGQVFLWGFTPSQGVDEGVGLWNSSSITSSTNISIAGFGSGSGSSGVVLVDSSAQSSGMVQLTGSGTGSFLGDGVAIGSSSQVEADKGATIQGWGPLVGVWISASQVTASTGQLSILGTGGQGGAFGRSTGVDVNMGSWVYDWKGEILVSGSGLSTGVEVDGGFSIPGLPPVNPCVVWSPFNRVILLGMASNGQNFSLAPWTVSGTTVATVGLQDAAIFSRMTQDLLLDGQLTQSDTLGLFDAAVVGDFVNSPALNDLAAITNSAAALGMSSTVQSEASTALGLIETFEVMLHWLPSSLYQLEIDWAFHVS